MNKKALCAAMAAAFVLTTAGTVLANPIELSGKINYQHRQNTDDGVDDSSGNRWQFILNGIAPEVAKNFDVYFRIGGEKFNGTTSLRDFEEFPGQDADDTSVFALDQFGFNYKNAGWNYKVGRQSTFIGATGLLYDDTGAFGKHIFGDGVTAAGKIGATDVKLSATKFDFYGDLDPKLYSAAVSYKPSKNLTVGGTFARLSLDGESSNVWAANAAYDLTSKVNIYGEYAKSNLDDQNKAYAFGGSYGLDGKNTFWTVYSRVEENATFSSLPGGYQSTTFDYGKKGMYYGFDHSFDKTTSLSLFYKDMKDLDDSQNHTSFRTTVSYKF